MPLHIFSGIPRFSELGQIITSEERNSEKEGIKSKAIKSHQDKIFFSKQNLRVLEYRAQPLYCRKTPSKTGLIRHPS
jgi:hypothetical protein